jgi:hypothetical protein
VAYSKLGIVKPILAFLYMPVCCPGICICPSTTVTNLPVHPGEDIALFMNNLRSLKLWNYPSFLTILDGLLRVNGSLNLTSFELVMDTACLGSHMGIIEEGEQIVDISDNGEWMMARLPDICSSAPRSH